MINEKDVKGRGLKGRVAVVTGSGGGIGRVIAVELARSGAKTVVADIDEQAVYSTAAEIEKENGIALPVKCDVRSEKEVDHLFQITVDKMSRVDALINNAGVYPIKKVVDMSFDHWKNVIDVNLNGTFLCARNAARIMIEKGVAGRIINISSSSGSIGRTGKAHYCASKAGINLLTKVLAIELASHNILVNAVAPGLVETEAKKEKLKTDPEERRQHEQKISEIPLGKICPPEQVAHVIKFLLSEELFYMTGQILTVDGGKSAGDLLDRQNRP